MMVSLIPTEFLYNFIELFAESTIIAAFFFLVASAISTIAPLYRSQIFKITFIGLLLFPVFHFSLPHWQFPLISLSGLDETVPSITSEEASGFTQIGPERVFDSTKFATLEMSDSYLKDESFILSFRQMRTLLQSVTFLKIVEVTWAIGAIVLLFLLSFSRLRARFLQRHSEEIKRGELKQLAQSIQALLGFSHPIRLLTSDRISMPMTWGIVHPIIYFPSNMSNWSYQRKKMVLLHEISHIRNGDNFYRLIGQLACCVYWFNPFVWKMYRLIASDQEKVCDEFVISTGIKPTDYAEQLITMTRQLSTARWAYPATAGMSRSRLEQRVIDLLSISTIKKEIPMRTKVTLTILFTFCFILIAIVSPFVLAEEENDEKTIEKKIEVMVNSDDPDSKIYTVTTDGNCDDIIIHSTATTELTQEEKDKIKEQIKSAMASLKDADIDVEKISADLESALDELEKNLPELEHITVDVLPQLDETMKKVFVKLDGTLLDENMRDKISAALEQAGITLDKKEEILQKLESIDVDKLKICETHGGDNKIIYLKKGEDDILSGHCSDYINLTTNTRTETKVLINKTSSFTDRESKKLEKAANKVQKDMPAGVNADYTLDKREFTLKIVPENGIELTKDEQKGIEETVRDFVQKVKKVFPEKVATVKIIEKIVKNDKDVV